MFRWKGVEPGGGGGGGGGGTEWLPTAKRPRGAEAVNAKIQGRSTHLKAKKGGRSTSNYEPNRGSNL